MTVVAFSGCSDVDEPSKRVDGTDPSPTPTATAKDNADESPASLKDQMLLALRRGESYQAVLKSSDRAGKRTRVEFTSDGSSYMYARGTSGGVRFEAILSTGTAYVRFNWNDLLPVSQAKRVASQMHGRWILGRLYDKPLSEITELLRRIWYAPGYGDPEDGAMDMREPRTVDQIETIPLVDGDGTVADIRRFGTPYPVRITTGVTVVRYSGFGEKTQEIELPPLDETVRFTDFADGDY
jgi:hypothetical protein